MEKGPDPELSTAPLFPSASLGVTGDEKIDLALKTTDFGDSLPKTDYSEGLQAVEMRDSTQGEEMEEHPMLHNVVATINVGCRLDLKEIVSKARNVEYNPKRFAALIMRIRNPKTTALCFNSGKIVVTGAKTEANCRMAGRKFTRILQKLGYDAHFTEFKIQNLVATSKTNFPIRLEGLVLKHSNFAHYEPELFPGLIYRMIKPKVVLLIFVSGQIVFTGAQKYSDIETAFRNILPVLKEFKKDPAPKTL